METESLIASVKKRSTIWDQRLSDHHNRYVLDRLWREVAEENGCTVRDVQGKWKSLRDYYRREFRKTQFHLTGDITAPAYTTSWPYFKHLDFLRDQFTARESSGFYKKKRILNDSENTEGSTEELHGESESSNLTSHTQTQRELSNKAFVDTEHCPQIVAFETNGCHFPSSLTIKEETPRSPSAPCAFIWPSEFQKNSKKCKIDHLQSLIDIEKRKVCILEEKMFNSKKDSTPDEDENFFSSVLPHVRIIQGVNKIRFRNEVQNLVIKYAYADSTTASSGSTDTKPIEHH